MGRRNVYRCYMARYNLGRCIVWACNQVLWLLCLFDLISWDILLLLIPIRTLNHRKQPINTSHFPIDTWANSQRSYVRSWLGKLLKFLNKFTAVNWKLRSQSRHKPVSNTDTCKLKLTNSLNRYKSDFTSHFDKYCPCQTAGEKTLITSHMTNLNQS